LRECGRGRRAKAGGHSCRIEPGASAFDREVLAKQGAAEAFDDAVGLRTLHARLTVLDALELEEQLVRWRSGGRQNSRPLSDSAVLIGMLYASKVGSTSASSRCTAVTGVFLV
jgi:hypothetical protein